MATFAIAVALLGPGCDRSARDGLPGPEVGQDHGGAEVDADGALPSPDAAPTDAVRPGDSETAEVPAPDGPDLIASACGDDAIVAPEECDDGNAVDDGNGCDASCQRNDVCGNGVVEPLYEGCDDGNQVLTDDCPDGPEGDCRPARCGDGHVAAGVEDCEVAGAVPRGECGADCRMTCEPGFGNCNGQADDGCETGLAGDADHCGLCGHSCRGTSCMESYCQPWVLWGFGSEGPGIMEGSMEVLGGWLFWVESWQTWPMPPEQPECGFGAMGIDPTEVLLDIKGGRAFDGAVSVVSDEEYAYWVDKDGELVRQSLSPGTVPSTERMASGFGGIYRYAMGNDHFYWSEAGAGEIRRMDNLSWTPETFASGLDCPQDLAVDGTTVYVLDWSSTRAEARLLALPMQGGPYRVLATTHGYGPIIVDDAEVFWMVKQPGLLTGSIQSTTKLGGVPRVYKEFALNADRSNVFCPWPVRPLENFALDSEYIYWSSPRWRDEGASTGVITRLPRVGGPEEVIVSHDTIHRVEPPWAITYPRSEPQPVAIAVDDLFLYWAEASQVRRVAK